MTVIKCGPINGTVAEAIESHDSSHNFFRKSGKNYQVVVDVADFSGETSFVNFADRLREMGSGVFARKYQSAFGQVQKIADRFRSDDLELEIPLREARWSAIRAMDAKGLVASATGRRMEVEGEPLQVFLLRVDLGRYLAPSQTSYRNEVDQILRRVRWYYEDVLTARCSSLDELPSDFANFVALSQFPDIRFDVPLGARRISDLKAFDPDSRFLTVSTRPAVEGSQDQIMRLTVDAVSFSRDESYRRSFHAFANRARVYYDSLMEERGYVPSDLDLDLRNFYAILRSFASLDPAVTPVADRPRDSRALFQDYLTAQYGGTDEIACNGFLREELLAGSFQSSFELRTAFLVHCDRGQQQSYYDLWLQKAPTPLKGLSLDDLLAVLSAAGPVGGAAQTGSGGTSVQSVTTTVPIHVGDGQATVGENTAGTAKFAQTLEPIGEESVVLYPTDADLPREIAFEFESVNWTRPADLSGVHGDPNTFIRPCAVHIVPSNYKGPIPPSEMDLRDWKDRNWREGIDDPTPYFMTLFPKRMGSTGKEILQVRLPQTKLPFKVVVQAGARSAPNDPYDNFDVTITATNLRLAPGVSESKATTIVLGEEFDNVTAIDNGRVVPLEGRIPQTANSVDTDFPRLSPQTYALYHPRVADPRADFSRAHRTIAVQRGKNYLFAPIISGIDRQLYRLDIADMESRLASPRERTWFLGSQPHVRVANGATEDLIIVTEGGVVTIRNNRVIAMEFYDAYYYLTDKMRERLRQLGDRAVTDETYGTGYHRPSIYTRWLIPQGGGDPWLAARALSSDDSQVTIEVTEPDATWSGVQKRYWVKYVVEKDSQGQWHVMTWKKEDLPSGPGRFRLVDRRQALDELDARQWIESYKNGSIKRPVLQLTAESDQIEIHLASDTTNVREESDRTFTGGTDEIRADNFGLVPLD